MALRLHDVDDAERFTRAIVTRSGLTLSFHDREDLGAYLVETCWELSLRYQAGGPSFSTYAGTILRRRAVDWVRQRDGRTIWKFKHRIHERPRREFVSLDGPARGGLVETLAERDGDREADRDEALGRYTPREIASELGTSTRWVSSRLDELRAELERLG